MKNHNINLLKVLLAIYLLFINGVAYAATANATQNPAAGTIGLIAFAIAYLSRRRAIGGWLLYFYFQLYIGILISLFFIPQIISNLDPNQWDDSFLYVMSFLSVVPVLVLQLLKVAIATFLLFQRNKRNVKYLRNIIFCLVLANTGAVIIDLLYFKDDPSIFFDAISLIFPIIWLLYFWKSQRVKMVFVDNNWSYIPYSERRALTSENKVRLRKRALISAVITFILFLIMMGSTLESEGTEPDSGIFFVPLFYAVLVAIIAWYLPIKNKKQQEKSESNST